MKALGGSFAIRSMSGEGTTATLTLPLPQTEKDHGACRVASDAQDGAGFSSHHSPCITPHTKSIRVLLVEDHAMVRQGLRVVLDAYEDIQVVGEAGDGAEALRLVEELQPRVLVMDINMPKMNGIEATTRIKAHWPDMTVVGISVNAGDENSDAMKRAGAATVLPKDTAVEQLHAAIVDAAEG
jgi:CheY-like chemotaxis protein